MTLLRLKKRRKSEVCPAMVKMIYENVSTKKLTINLWFFSLFALGLAYRLSFITIPYVADEAWTFLYFAKFPLSQFLYDYSFPNNHFFHTILMHFCYRLFGMSEIGMRMPTFLFGLLTMGLTYVFAFKMFNNRVIALVSLFFVACSHALVFYSVSARGYSVQTALCVAVAVYGLFSETPNQLFKTIVMAGLGFLVLFTIPSGIIFLLPFYIYVFFFVDKTAEERKRTVFRLAIPFIVAGIFYLPFLRQMKSFARGESGGIALTANLTSFLSEMIGYVGSGLFPSFVALIILIVSQIMLFKKDRKYILFPMVIFFHLILVLLLFKAFPFVTFFARNYLCLLPFVYISLAYALVHFVQSVNRTKSILAFAAVVVLFGWGRRDPRDTYFPYVSSGEIPEEEIWLETRELTKQVASQIQSDEKIYSSDSSWGGEISFYTGKVAGFKGNYGLWNLYSRKIRNIYVLGRSKEEVADFKLKNLNGAFWSDPELLTKREHIGVFVMRRINTDQPSPEDGPFS